MKLQTKITLVFFSITTIGLVLMNAAIFYFVSEFSFDDFFKRLEARVNLAAEIKIHPDENSIPYQEVRNRYLEKLPQEREYIVKLDEYRRFEKPLPLSTSFYKAILANRKARYSAGNHFYAGGFFNTAHGQYIVIIAAEDPYGFKELEELKRVLLVIFVIAIILTYVAGKVFSFYTVKPVRAIIKRVQNITANNLHLRLPETKGKDEIAEMVLTFNDMLNRLETAFETQNNFVSNASHELRTPLTILTSETELLTGIDGLPEPAQQSAKAILSQAEKLEHILSSLLGLAQSGFNGKKQNWEVIRIDELVMHVANAVKKIEPEGVIDLNFDELPDDESQLLTSGNVNLLQLALSNIVLNACKYSNNSPVEIKVFVENGRIVIAVSDKGIGIPDDEQQHIFEPFFRASNTSDFEGHGIGLPLTLNIIRLHKGTIGIRSEQGIGTEIQILLPIHSN
ncbi:sensor histidine kinase [Pedobacter duraquae]|uniref:histidine kinase n=1 Tax=Pedobacter duraquae TaxID=425511 RepID=A0A4R6ILZ6_9SPHI|nr:HAMP domain-containing sensor histidine kinase [Pedobacter duraquae]TDO23189.1 signal transduction histidine kinase [Pedobacter duraquae]